MKIDVRYFAWVRERIGVGHESVETNAATPRALIEEVIAAEDRETLTHRVKALDRVLRDQLIWVPNWYKGSHWIAYWDVFGFPDEKPPYDRGTDYWWFDQEKYDALIAAGALR